MMVVILEMQVITFVTSSSSSSSPPTPAATASLSSVWDSFGVTHGLLISGSQRPVTQLVSVV